MQKDRTAETPPVNIVDDWRVPRLVNYVDLFGHGEKSLRFVGNAIDGDPEAQRFVPFSASFTLYT